MVICYEVYMDTKCDGAEGFFSVINKGFYEAEYDLLTSSNKKRDFFGCSNKQHGPSEWSNELCGFLKCSDAPMGPEEAQEEAQEDFDNFCADNVS